MKARESKTQYAVLGMLSLSPKSAYEIKKAIQNSTGHFWSESDGQLYPILKRLHETGLVKCKEDVTTNRPGKKIYELTKTGRNALVDWLQQDPVTFNTRNEFLLQLFFGHNLKPKQNKQKIMDLLHNLKQQLKLYDAIEKQIKEKSKHPKYLLMSLAYGQYSLKAEMAWCKDMLKMLGDENE